MGAVFSDLNLDGDAPVRARPEVGEWGPAEVRSTAAKKRQRSVVVAAFVLAVLVITAIGYFWYDLLMDSLR
jgi:hypothetical protein